jgi:hypothetical protein
MGKLQKMMDVFSAEADVYSREKYVDGKPSGEYTIVRDVDITLNSTYGEWASVTLTVEEAKQVVSLLQEAIKKASRSEKKILAEEKNRMKDLDNFLSNLKQNRTEEA